MKRAEGPVISAGAAARKRETSAALLQLAFILIQGPIALLIPKHSTLATYQALLTFGIGMFAAVLLRRPVVVACICAYITGAAVFWRMRAAPLLPWEAGKYAIIAILGAAILFAVRVSRPGLPVLYFALLLPSVPLTLSAVPWEEARSSLSFNLSGPLCLTMSVLFFSAIRLSRSQMRWVAVSLVAPIFGIAIVAAQNLQQALEDPEFEFAGGSSNAVSSGGFRTESGFSRARLGDGRHSRLSHPATRLKIVTATMMAIMLLLARQCLITLSRGGMYMTVGATLAAAVFLLQDPALRTAIPFGSGRHWSRPFLSRHSATRAHDEGFSEFPVSEHGWNGPGGAHKRRFRQFRRKPDRGAWPGNGWCEPTEVLPRSHGAYRVHAAARRTRDHRRPRTRGDRCHRIRAVRRQTLVRAAQSQRRYWPMQPCSWPSTRRDWQPRAFAVGLASAMLLPRLRRTRVPRTDVACSMA